MYGKEDCRKRYLTGPKLLFIQGAGQYRLPRIPTTDPPLISHPAPYPPDLAPVYHHPLFQKALKTKTKKWIFVTKMDCLLKDMKIKSMEEVYLFFPPREGCILEVLTSNNFEGKSQKNIRSGLQSFRKALMVPCLQVSFVYQPVSAILFSSSQLPS
ncbi:hypothetical protein STEG23_009291 [Scotinomys teguina]